MHRRRRFLRASISRALPIAFIATACVQVYQKLEPTELPPTDRVVRTPVKAHMHDGSIVVFADGATISSGVISGAGVRHPLRAQPFPVASVPLDSIVGVETFATPVQPVQTAVGSTLGTAAVIGGAAVLAVAIFGSCPTFYADSAGTQVLQAEAFSYAIAPMFEHRDTDRLRLRAASDGMVRLEVRNEALETHYINHLELLEVAHTAEETAITDGSGRPLILRQLRQPDRVIDAAGRDVSAIVAGEDGSVYSTSPAFIARRSATDLNDHLDFTIQLPTGSDSAAIVLRLRNSLLNTVLLYDEILAASGPRALDWMAEDLNRISTALELGEWYTSHMGMRVQVRDGASFRTVARVSDVGPIAYHDIVTVIPVQADGSTDVRLSFVADNWRIDRIAYATEFRRAHARVVPLAATYVTPGEPEIAAIRSLSAPDEDYLVTTPGQRFTVEFDAGPVAASAERTFFLASQGYYIEWMRPDWLRNASAGTFVPSAASIYSALNRWSEKRDSFEQQFYASKIPVR